MKCPRCDNEDPRYFYKGSKGWYCRKCISFQRVMLEEELEPVDYQVNENSNEYEFSFELTEKQKEISKKLKEIIREKDILLYCVCGAGKTELTVETISSYLKEGKKVCYAISRKEVVKELSKRFEKMFGNARVISLYGGHVKETKGDLILCTTHQLYRYPHTFDLLILDEVDAFPLKGNDTLMHIALNSCKGHVIYSTATVNYFLRKYLERRDYETLELLVRPSMKPLIDPKVIYAPRVIQYLILLFLMSGKESRCILFVPTKKLCRILYYLLCPFFSITYAYSDLNEKDRNIARFQSGECSFIISTSILERGVTFKDIDVIILDLVEGVFDEAALIQMTGRVGRNIKNPYGSAHILSSHHSKSIRLCKKNIERANHALSLLR